MWLARNELTPLRFLVAPAGCGKTNAIVSYLRSRGIPFGYCLASAACTPEDLFKEIAGALELEATPATFEALLEALRACGKIILAIENIELAEESVRPYLTRLIEEAPEETGLIYASRTWEAIDIERIAPHGLAAVCDDRMLAFTADEITRLAEHLGVAYAPEDAQRLADDCEGWAIVAASAVREAAERGRSLARAYDRWQEHHGYLFKRFVESTGYQSCLSPRSQTELEEMRRAGLFVRHDAHGYHYLYRVVERIFSGAPPRTAPPLESPPLVARVLGEFHTEIGTEEIRWIRRRDQQIFLYLLLKEDGSASRLELCERFWPDAEPELRAASLRVACSNIRRAIGNIVGNSRVERYLRTDGDIALNFSNITLDARRFRLHAASGDEQYEQGNLAEAMGHYRLAEKLYGGPLGWCANIDRWTQEQADAYESIYLGVLDRLVALHRRADDAEHVFEYAQKAASTQLERHGFQEPAAAC